MPMTSSSARRGRSRREMAHRAAALGSDGLVGGLAYADFSVRQRLVVVDRPAVVRGEPGILIVGDAGAPVAVGGGDDHLDDAHHFPFVVGIVVGPGRAQRNIEETLFLVVSPGAELLLVIEHPLDSLISVGGQHDELEKGISIPLGDELQHDPPCGHKPSEVDLEPPLAERVAALRFPVRGFIIVE